VREDQREGGGGEVDGQTVGRRESVSRGSVAGKWKERTRVGLERTESGRVSRRDGAKDLVVCLCRWGTNFGDMSLPDVVKGWSRSHLRQDSRRGEEREGKEERKIRTVEPLNPSTDTPTDLLSFPLEGVRLVSALVLRASITEDGETSGESLPLLSVVRFEDQPHPLVEHAVPRL
jgi:hypothetical protein